ncbi:hypothetical protein [Desulfonema magnum]|uniref:DUF104 domain-containing protein n=1 Tax=Desulfonema magnum TaxID=45655 RepID=A0A975BII3_9BACT|nr:hypothetical protein [Desulfonema magnum]QTA85968.1 Uncharacterized protein dnm_019850 [Desulfonema magnum]
MNLMIEAIYDGKAFLPVEPLFLRPDTRVKISVMTTESEQPASFLKVARSLELDGPEDWSAKLDEYLYGDKRTG